MKKFSLVLVALFSFTAFAAEAPAKPADKPADKAAGGMAEWKPKKVTKKDTKGIDALYKACEEAMKKGDVAALEALHDFPVYMLTDNAAGATSGGEWNKEMWTQVMKPMIENMPKDVKMTHKAKPTFVTDSIAFVEETHTMTVGKGKPETWTSAAIVVLKDGKWMMKGGAEGGWGDMPMPEKKAEAVPAAPGSKTADAKAPAAPAKK